MDRFLTKAAFAKLVGIKAPSVTYLCKPGKALHKAVVGKKIDLEHPATQEYLEQHKSKEKDAKKQVAKQKDAAKDAPKTVKTPDGHEYTPINVLEAHPDEFLDLTMRQIYHQFGSMEEFKTAIAVRKTMSEINFKELQSMEKRGELIPREIVKTHIFGAMNTSNLRMLRDIPKTATTKAIAMLKSGQKPAAVEAMIRELIGKNLAVVESTANRILKEA